MDRFLRYEIATIIQQHLFGVPDASSVEMGHFSPRSPDALAEELGRRYDIRRKPEPKALPPWGFIGDWAWSEWVMEQGIGE